MRIQMWTPNGGASIEIDHDQVDGLKAKGFHTKDPNATVKAPKGKPKTSKEVGDDDGDISR